MYLVDQSAGVAPLALGHSYPAEIEDSAPRRDRAPNGRDNDPWRCCRSGKEVLRLSTIAQREGLDWCKSAAPWSP